MLKYKEQIENHIEQSVNQLEKLNNKVQYNTVTKEEHSKWIVNIINKLTHCSNLVELEEG